MPVEFKNPLIAHRGASAYAPENTIASFKKAYELGAQWIECDVMQAVCGNLFIFHDETLDRTTNASGDPRKMTYHELSQLDAGSWFNDAYKNERIPDLNSALTFFNRHQLSVNLELKPVLNEETQLVKTLLSQLGQRHFSELPQILFSSFSLPALYALRALDPNAPLGILLEEWDKFYMSAIQDLAPVSVHFDVNHLNDEVRNQLQGKGLLVTVYTVNDSGRAKQLLESGVDALFTDYPDLLTSPLI